MEEIEPNARQSLWNLIDERLGSFNVAKTGFDEFYRVSIFLRGANDEVLGGLIGNIWGGGCSSEISGSRSQSAGTDGAVS